MPKIGKESVKYGDGKWLTYDLYYLTSDKVFYAKIDQFDENLKSFYHSEYNTRKEQKDSDDALEGISLFRIRGNGTHVIYGDSHERQHKNMKAFLNKYFNSTKSEEKVIIYKFEYLTPKQKKMSYGFGASNNTQSNIKFNLKYDILIKHTFNDQSTYYHEEDKRMVSNHYIVGKKEVKWTRELEDCLVSLGENFDLLIERIKPFFEEDGKIFELIGSNVLKA